MKELRALWKRNMMMFFRDRGMFLSALIAPLILIVLDSTFLGSVYRESILDALALYLVPDTELVNGLVSGWMFSSLLAVSCVTVSFACSTTMMDDKVSGAEKDFAMTPVSRSMRLLSYFLATACTAGLIALTVFACCLIWLGFSGWYLSFSDLFYILMDLMLLCLFGAGLSTAVQMLLKTPGQARAVSVLVTSIYGFLCGAYMPLAQISAPVRRLVSLLPGTSGTVLLHRHFMQGVYEEMERLYPLEAVQGIREAFDGFITVNGTVLSQPQMYGILSISCLLLVLLFFLLAERTDPMRKAGKRITIAAKKNGQRPVH